MSFSSGPPSEGSPSASGMRYFSPNQRPRSMLRQRGEQNGNSGHSAAPWPSMTRSQIGQRTFIIGLHVFSLELFSAGFVPLSPAGLSLLSVVPVVLSLSALAAALYDSLR